MLYDFSCMILMSMVVRVAMCFADRFLFVRSCRMCNVGACLALRVRFPTEMSAVVPCVVRALVFALRIRIW